MRKPSILKAEISEVWSIVWPLILTNLLNVLVGVIDFKMVGVLGVSEIAAVGMARQVVMLFMVIMLAVSGGASVLVAHAHGANDRKRVGLVTARALSFMLVGTVLIITPFGYFFSESVLTLLGGNPKVVTLGSVYLKIIFLGGVLTMANFALSGILLGVGKTKVSLVLLVIVNLLNVVFNYIFIFGIGPVPALGVAGAAVGTVLARGFGSLPAIWILTSARFPVQMKFRDCLSIDFSLLRKILYLGGPRSLQGIVRNFSRLTTLRIITLLPNATEAVSAFTVGMQVRMVSAFIGLAFMAAAMSRVGQNMGKGEPERAENSGWIAAGMATVILTLVAVLFLVFPEAIMGFFTTDRDVIKMGMNFFVIIAVTEPVMASGFALGGALRGGGDSVSPFIYSSVTDLVVVIVLGYILAIQLNFGFAGIAIAMATGSLTRTVPTALKFRAGKWKMNRLHESM